MCLTSIEKSKSSKNDYLDTKFAKKNHEFRGIQIKIFIKNKISHNLPQKIQLFGKKENLVIFIDRPLRSVQLIYRN